MTAAEGMRARLLEISDVIALVPAARITLLKSHQGGDKPSIRVQGIGQDEIMHLRGAVSICRSRVQIDFIAKEGSGSDPYAEAVAVEEAAHGAGDGTGLIGFRGNVGGSPPFVIDAIFPVDRRENYDADELRHVRISRDYFVWFQRN